MPPLTRTSSSFRQLATFHGFSLVPRNARSAVLMHASRHTKPPPRYGPGPLSDSMKSMSPPWALAARGMNIVVTAAPRNTSLRKRVISTHFLRSPSMRLPGRGGRLERRNKHALEDARPADARVGEPDHLTAGWPSFSTEDERVVFELVDQVTTFALDVEPLEPVQEHQSVRNDMKQQDDDEQRRDDRHRTGPHLRTLCVLQMHEPVHAEADNQ